MPSKKFDGLTPQGKPAHSGHDLTPILTMSGKRAWRCHTCCMNVAEIATRLSEFPSDPWTFASKCFALSTKPDNGNYTRSGYDDLPTEDL